MTILIAMNKILSNNSYFCLLIIYRNLRLLYYLQYFIYVKMYSNHYYLKMIKEILFVSICTFFNNF